jgi:hypothetical protein
VRREKRFTTNHAPNNRINPIGCFAPPPPSFRYSPICNLQSQILTPASARALAEAASCCQSGCVLGNHRLYRAHERPMPGCSGDTNRGGLQPPKWLRS